MKNVNRKEKKDSDKICFESHDCLLAVKNEELTESPGIVVRINVRHNMVVFSIITN